MDKEIIQEVKRRIQAKSDVMKSFMREICAIPSMDSMIGPVGERIAEEMRKLGFNTGVTQTPITPVMLGDVQLARQFSRELLEEGIFAGALGFPTVPRGKARIRVMISAAHSQDDLEQALDAFERIGKKLGKGTMEE